MAATGNLAWPSILHSLSHFTNYYSLNLWGVPKGNDDLLNPLGSTGINPNSESPNLTVEFETGAHPIVFPNHEQISEFADFLTRLDQQENHSQVSDDDDDDDGGRR